MDHNTANSRLTNTDKSLTKLRSSITLLAYVLCSTLTVPQQTMLLNGSFSVCTDN